MAKMKYISKDAVAEAYAKAEHYRLLNEPWQAESICRDILNVDPENQEAIYTLILAITDQFINYSGTTSSEALDLASKLTDPYKAEYCRGLIFERKAIATHRRQIVRGVYIAFAHFQRAMQHFEKAEKLQSGTNNESILRWNACVRFIEQHKLKPSPDKEWVEPFLDV